MTAKSTFEVYNADNRMRDIIADNSLLLMALSRFGISLGFGDATIKEVCHTHHVDCNTFLAVANLISDNPYNVADLSLQPLITYLKNAHTYFIDFSLPNIRRKLIEAVSGTADKDVAFLILKFYDDYVEEVKRHMEFENDSVFAYVEGLLRGERNPEFRITRFTASHRPIGVKLKELKDIFICHYTQQASADLLNSVLFDIIVCEHDLLSHCQVEDLLFVPTVERLEKALKKSASTATAPTYEASHERVSLDSLTEREKDIIRCVARGMANKEIADQLCVSVHTVTTHRRNISTKLGIHSSAGIAIFAIMNHLLDLNEIHL